MKKAHLTFEEHKEIARQLHDYRVELTTMAVLLGNRFLKTAPYYGRLSKAIGCINEVRSSLEAVMYRDCRSELEAWEHETGESAVDIYYPGSRG